MIDIKKIEPNKINSNMKSKFWCFYGAQGCWKTTVASKFPRPLLLGFEVGYQFIDGIRAAKINSWSEVKDIYTQLRDPKTKDMYDTIIFDTITGAYDLCYHYVLDEFGVSDPNEVPYGQGWRAIKQEFGIINKISKLGYGLVFNAHAKEVDVTKNKVTTTTVKVDCDSIPASVVNDLCDFVLYVRKETDENGVEQVYAYSSYPGVDCKSRCVTFPKRILFTYDSLESSLKEAIVKLAGDAKTDDSNIHVNNEEPWTSVRDEVIGLVKKIMGTPAEADVTRYIMEIFPNTRLSQTTELDKGKLIAARDYLKGLKTDDNVKGS
jgi:hypothetical protein